MPPTGLTIFNTETICIEVNVGTPLSPNWLCLKGDSDDQDVTQFGLDGNILTISIEGGNTMTADLTDIIGVDTDDQTITDLSLNGTELSITIDGGNTQVVDLSSLNTDDQIITNFDLTGSILTIEIENGNSSTVDLSNYPGLQGQDGMDGVSVDSASHNNDGTVTFYFSDNTIFTTRDLTGPQGQAGVDGEDGAAVSYTHLTLPTICSV